MAETNPYLAMSPAERARQKELLEQAMATEGALLDVVAAASLRWGFNRLKERANLGRRGRMSLSSPFPAKPS